MKQPMQAALSREAFLRQRWDRIGLGVRLAYNSWQPGVIRCYLQAGSLLVRSGAMPELTTQQRMLQLLLQTAADPSLPWAWPSACHEYMVFPPTRTSRFRRVAGATTPSRRSPTSSASFWSSSRHG